MTKPKLHKIPSIYEVQDELLSALALALDVPVSQVTPDKKLGAFDKPVEFVWKAVDDYLRSKHVPEYIGLFMPNNRVSRVVGRMYREVVLTKQRENAWENRFSHVNSVTLPPGTYYFGDPCYYVSENRWGHVADVYTDLLGEDVRYVTPADPDNPLGLTKFPIEGHMMAMCRTGWGDGTWYGNGDISYSVDSGTLGLVPDELSDDERRKKLLNECCGGIAFRSESDVTFKHDHGVLSVEFTELGTHERKCYRVDLDDED